MSRLISATAVFALVSAAIFLCDPIARGCEFDRSQIARGQVWRLLTCHLAHWSNAHAVWSGGAFVVLAAACERRNFRTTLLAIALSAAAISMTIWFALPGVLLYRGLSGVDSALFALLPILLLREDIGNRSRAAILVAAYVGFIAKTAFELQGGGSLFVGSSEHFVPLPWAHVVGFIVGAIVGVIPTRPARPALWRCPPPPSSSHPIP